MNTWAHRIPNASGLRSTSGLWTLTIDTNVFPSQLWEGWVMDTCAPVLVCLLLWYILQMPFYLGPALLTPSQPTLGDQATSYKCTKHECTINTIYFLATLWLC